MTENVLPTAKIYLGSPFFNPIQQERAKKAKEILAQNPTVNLIHFPFDYQYKDADVDNQKDGIFGSLEWQIGTYNNDLSAMATATCGVFLYDLDNIDDGCAFEIGFLRALHKPVILVMFSEKEQLPDLNLMIARGATAFIDGKNLEALKEYNFNAFPTIVNTENGVY